MSLVVPMIISLASPVASVVTVVSINTLPPDVMRSLSAYVPAFLVPNCKLPVVEEWFSCCAIIAADEVPVES